MGEQTLSQVQAVEDWAFLKRQARYWASWKYTPSQSRGVNREAYAGWVATMRNAWVAYHAGTNWMHPGQSAMLRMCKRNARLTAEVERLRSGITDLRVGLLRGLRPGDGTEPEPMTEVSGVVACLDALVREDGGS